MAVLKLFNHGILGINARNLLYVKPHNPQKAVHLADDKIATKFFFEARGVPVPKMLARISNKNQLDAFDWDSLPNNFVLKPNHGYGGEGIIVIIERKKNFFIKASGQRIHKEELFDHIESILSGKYSITNTYDTAFFEQRLIPHDVFSHFTNIGLPDVRVVVHNLIPTMAMIRVPTQESEGKANVHLGAVGIGVDIAKGTTTFAVQRNNFIRKIPHFGDCRGIKIPYWDEILLIASKIQQISNLGYLACDIVIDKKEGPTLLEINARAGLMVQLANRAPLHARLERIEGLKVASPEKGVRIGQDLFGQKVEETIKNISGKSIIGNVESVEMLLPQGGTKTLKAKISVNNPKTVISKTLAHEIFSVEHRESRKHLKVKFALGGRKIQTLVDIEDEENEENYDVIVGNRDLNDFLIDPRKEFVAKDIIPQINTDFSSIDQRLCDIDRKLRLIAHLTPLNLEEEKVKFMRNEYYNPVFEYPELSFDAKDLLDRIKYIETKNTPLGKLFEKKKREIENKIMLLKNRGIGKEFTNFSLKLYPKFGLRFVRLAKELLNTKSIEQEEKTMNAFEAKAIFEEVFKRYGLHQWKVVVKDSMIANCSVNKKKTLFLKAGKTFTESHIEKLIRHEVETHVLTTENGKAQPYQLFVQGTANYLYTQEGLAIYNQTHFRSDGSEQVENIGIGLLAVYFALEHSFAKTFHMLCELGIPSENALKSTLKAKRGLRNTGVPGAFTKDSVYLVGYDKIKTFVEKENGDLKRLYIGKINIEDIDIIEAIHSLKPSQIIPGFLKQSSS